jgi:lysophospholipase L1-like esterase
MGTTITAGWQSDGINDSTQVQSFAVLLAQQMRTPFFVPLMSRPGCPPPLTDVYAQTRVPPPVPNNCALRTLPVVPPPYISNVAVPGALVVDGLENLGNPTALTTFFLGGQTQFQALRRATPTFVTVELGITDALRSATDTLNAGNPALITPVATFQTQYGELLDSLQAANPGGVLLIGVPYATVVPYFSKGSYFDSIATRGPTDATPDTFPPNFTVNPNCAAPGGDNVLIPFPAGAARVAFAKANPGTPVGVDCADDVNVLASELGALTTAVTGYNTFIQSQAAARSSATGRPWVYVDVNLLLAALPPGAIPAFPNTPPRPTSVTAPFGPFFSLDGVHPSAATHKLVANALIQTINTAYATSLQPIP